MRAAGNHTGTARHPREAPPGIDLGDLPNRGQKLRLLDASSAAHPKRAAVEPLHFLNALRPLGPQLDVGHHLPHALRRRVYLDGDFEQMRGIYSNARVRAAHAGLAPVDLTTTKGGQIAECSASSWQLTFSPFKYSLGMASSYAGNSRSE